MLLEENKELDSKDNCNDLFTKHMEEKKKHTVTD